MVSQALPVRLQGTVTYYDPGFDPNFAFLFLHDDTGDIFVKLSGRTPLPVHQGTPVEVAGVTEAGEFAPIVSHAKLCLLNKPPHVPPAPLINLQPLLAGEYDARFLSLDGVVQATSAVRNNVVLKLATGNGVMTAITPRQPGFDYAGLVYAQVRIKANAGPLFNRRRQVTGAVLFYQDSADLTILQPPPADPFAGPPRAIGQVIEMEHGMEALSMVHLRGRVVLYWPEHLLCLQDAKEGLCVQTTQPGHLADGETVDVVGFPSVENRSIGLVEARFQGEGVATARPLKPVPATLEELLRGKHASELVTVEGRLLGINENRGEDWEDPTLMIEVKGRAVVAVIPRGLENQDWHDTAKGSLLRLTGICLPEADAHWEDLGERNAHFDSFRLMLRSPADVVVVETPSWWSGRHLLYVLQGGAAVVMVGCFWVILLRRRVRAQTQEIRKSRELFQHLAQHDTLTGLANRGLLQERLKVALDQSCRHKTAMAVMMIDLDKFKGINDTFGHHAGDAVLCATAERISRSVRAGDTVARMGGDEFVVLLPVLGDLAEARTIAERIVEAMAAPLEVDGRTIPMSASVGVCSSRGDCSAEALMRRCDDALYGAKGKGRNCWAMFEAAINLPVGA